MLMQRNFDNFYNLLAILTFELKVIYISKTVSCNNSINHFLYKSPNYKSNHEVRNPDNKSDRGGATLEKN